MNYNEFYKKYGNRRSTSLIEPKTIDNDSFQFPRNSILQWVMVSDIVTPMTTDYGYLHNEKLPVVTTPLKYSTNIELLGNPILKPIVVARIMKELKSNEPTFKFLKPNTKSVRIPNTKLFIFNYGVMGATYRYSINPLNDYYKYVNSMKTILYNSSIANVGNGRHQFILIDLPLSLPSRMILDRFLTKMTKVGLEHFSTYKHLIILELWKFLSPDTESLFDVLTLADYKNITLMFNSNGKISFLNLNLLLSLSKDMPDVITTLNKVPAETLKKMFYVFITKLSNVVTIPDDIVVKKVNGTVSNIAANNNMQLEEDEDHLDSKNIDRALSEELDDIPASDSIDDMVTDSEIEKIAETGMTTYSTKKELLGTKDNVKEELTKKLNLLKKYKIISKAKFDSLQESLENQTKISIDIPGKGPVKLTDLLTITDADLTLTTKETELPTAKTVFDPTMNRNVTEVMTSKYIENLHYKNITKSLFGLQKAGVIIDNYNIETHENILGKFEIHTLEVKLLDGSKSKLMFKLPTIAKDGSFKMSTHSYRMRMQKVDKVIVKVGFNKVNLNTFYGKLSVTKATFKKDDAGYVFRNKLLKLSETNKEISKIGLLDNIKMDQTLPIAYTTISRYVKKFTLGSLNYNFDYDNRDKLLPKTKLASIEKGKILVGLTDDNKPLLMSDNGEIYLDNKPIGTILHQLGLKQNVLPIEYANLKVFKKQIPLVCILSYYLGLQSLFKILNTKFTKHVTNERVTLEPNQYAVVFKDIKLVIEKDYGLSDMIISGLISMKNIIKNVNFSTMTNKDSFNILFNMMELGITYINEIKLLETLYIDPMSENVLKSMHEPIVFKALLIRAAELLLVDDYKNPNNVTNILIKGYERIPGIIYNELVRSMKEHANASIFGKSKLQLNPYSIWATIGSDSTTVLIDDLNPVAEIKQAEDVSALGKFGRIKETFTKDTRSIDESEIGLFSEAVKDNGDVGITAYLSGAPIFKNMLGEAGKFSWKEDGMTSVLSTPGLLTPFTVTDDPKRSIDIIYNIV